MKTVLAATVAAIFIAATSAQAETIQFEFDQAFWGTKPASSEPVAWQAGREAAVAANPTGFKYMTGGFDFDTLYGIASNFALTVDFGTVSHTFTLNNPASNSFVSKTRGTDFQIFTFGYTITDSFGPMVTYGDTTEEQYNARLDLSFVYHKASQQLSTRATSYVSELERRERQEYCYNPYEGGLGGPCGPVIVSGAYGAAPNLAFDLFGQGAYVAPTDTTGGGTTGGGGSNTGGGGTTGGGSTDPDISPVPLPASGLMLLSVLGAGAVISRRRKVA